MRSKEGEGKEINERLKPNNLNSYAQQFQIVPNFK